MSSWACVVRHSRLDLNVLNVEVLEQLALFGPGKEALLGNESVVPALEAVVELGMTEEAKEHARGALIALLGVTEKHEVVVAKHVMLSYSWEDQSTIVRINESLKRRRYSTWLDVRCRCFLDLRAHVCCLPERHPHCRRNR